MSVTNIAMGELVVTINKDSILKTFVGSCVAVCLYDVQQKIAGMAHVMLPKNLKNSPPKNPGKYADEAISHILKKMQRNGSKIKNIKAKMAGGAQIFAHEGGNTEFDIGRRNTIELCNLLESNKIVLVSKDCGGTTGRTVTFDVPSESMTIKNISKGERKI